jgi:hypothetical protein
MVETPMAIRLVCKTIPVLKPNINLNEVLNPFPKLVTITNTISGPGVNANITEAIVNDSISEIDNLFLYFVDMLP